MTQLIENKPPRPALIATLLRSWPARRLVQSRCISNRNIARLETHLTSAKSIRAHLLIATKRDMRFSRFAERRLADHSFSISPNSPLTFFLLRSIVNHMVKHLTAILDATFGALSDATRRGILAQLALGETSVSDLAAPYDMSLPAVSKHLRVLEDAGLVQRHKDGRVHRCRLAPEPMKGAAEWIAYYRHFWERQFDALEQYLADSQTPAAQKEKQSWQVPLQAPASPSGSSERSRRRAKKSGRRGPNAKG